MENVTPTTEVNSFSEFQLDLKNFVTNNIDNYHKEKFFLINKRIYEKMYLCFENVRQVTEKIEECVKKEENERNNLMIEMNRVYANNSKNIERCANKCKSEKDLECLIECADLFKNNYKSDMKSLVDNYKIKYVDK